MEAFSVFHVFVSTYISCFDYSYSERCDLISHSDFNLHCYDYLWYWTFFMYICWIFVCFIWRNSQVLYPSCLFYYWIVGVPYVFWILTLYALPVFFSNFLGYPFTLLIIYWLYRSFFILLLLFVCFCFCYLSFWYYTPKKCVAWTDMELFPGFLLVVLYFHILHLILSHIWIEYCYMVWDRESNFIL